MSINPDQAAATGLPKSAAPEGVDPECWEMWTCANADQKRDMLDICRWLLAGSPPDSDPRVNWPEDIQTRLRAAGLT